MRVELQNEGGGGGRKQGRTPLAWDFQFIPSFKLEPEDARRGMVLHIQT
jgi:hypothetical protein